MKDLASMGNLFAHELQETSARKEYIWQLLLCPLKRMNREIRRLVVAPKCIKTKKKVWGIL